MSAPLWKQLSTAALLGVGRGSPALTLPAGLQELLPEPEAGPAEHFLATAAVVWAAQTAGYVPAQPEDELPEPCAPEPRPPIVEPHLVATLARLPEDGPEGLIMEVLQRLSAGGWTLPPRLIPRYLDAAKRSVALREPVLGATGNRGAWLAAQNPAWQFARTAGADHTDVRCWEEGDTATRSRYLRQLRTTDPSAARTLLQQTFPNETARDRTLLLATMSEHLSGDDESFLEDLLFNDRSKEVRQVAGRLLSTLPGSAFASRMVSYLSPCITRETKLLRSQWAVSPPGNFPPEAGRDGIEEKPPAGLKLGARAWWLRQLVARAPLGWWTDHTGMSPLELFLWAAKSEWNEALLAGFAEAIPAQSPGPDWVEPLLQAGALGPQPSVELLRTLPESRRADAWIRLAGSCPSFSWWLKALLQDPMAWPGAFWLQVEQSLVTHLKTDAAQHDYELRGLFPELACRMPETRWSSPVPWPTSAKAWSVFEAAAHRFQEIVSVRQRFQQISPPA